MAENIKTNGESRRAAGFRKYMNAIDMSAQDAAIEREAKKVSTNVDFVVGELEKALIGETVVIATEDVGSVHDRDGFEMYIDALENRGYIFEGRSDNIGNGTIVSKKGRDYKVLMPRLKEGELTREFVLARLK